MYATHGGINHHIGHQHSDAQRPHIIQGGKAQIVYCGDGAQPAQRHGQRRQGQAPSAGAHLNGQGPAHHVHQKPCNQEKDQRHARYEHIQIFIFQSSQRKNHHEWADCRHKVAAKCQQPCAHHDQRGCAPYYMARQQPGGCQQHHGGEIVSTCPERFRAAGQYISPRCGPDCLPACSAGLKRRGIHNTSFFSDSFFILGRRPLPTASPAYHILSVSAGKSLNNP